MGSRRGGLSRRVVAEEDADRGGEQEAAGNRGGEIGVGHPVTRRDRCENSDSDHNAGDAAAHAEKHRLGQELKQHMQAAGADRHAQADLARPLGHRDEQDIHDADAADQRARSSDRRKQKRHDAAAALGGLGDLAQVAHGEIIGAARPDAVPARRISVTWSIAGWMSA